MQRARYSTAAAPRVALGWPARARLRPGCGQVSASAPGAPFRRRTLELATLGLVLAPAAAAAFDSGALARRRAAAAPSAAAAAAAAERPAAAPRPDADGGMKGGRRTDDGDELFESMAQQGPSADTEVDSGSDSDSGSESDSSSSSDDEMEGGERRPAARRGRRPGEAGPLEGRAMKQQLKEQRKEAERAEQAARKAEKQRRRADAALAPGQPSPSELPIPRAAAVEGDEAGAGGEKPLSWLLGDLLH